MTEVYTDRAPLTTAAIPAEMKSYPSWVLWRYEGRNGKPPTKVPYVAGEDRRASTTDSRTWRSFDKAVAAYEAGQADGIGFVLSSGDRFCAIDLDGAATPRRARSNRGRGGSSTLRAGTRR